VKGIAWRCQFCGDWITQAWLQTMSSVDVKNNFRLQVDAHVDFHTDVLMDEIKEATRGQVPD
jgi:hypothetical protein